MRKAGPTGIELDAVQLQQKEVKADAASGELKALPGFGRTKAMEAIERSLHAELKLFNEDDRFDVLVRLLAQSRLETVFERIYRVVFGSQIELLRHLNAVDRVPVDEILFAKG